MSHAPWDNKNQLIDQLIRVISNISLKTLHVLFAVASGVFCLNKVVVLFVHRNNGNQSVEIKQRTLGNE